MRDYLKAWAKPLESPFSLTWHILTMEVFDPNKSTRPSIGTTSSG